MLPDSLETSAEALRRAFDGGFSAPRAVAQSDGNSYLAIQIAGQRGAIPLSHAASVLRCPSITCVPTASSSLLGVAVVRGSLVAMYDLAVLLGRSNAGRRRASWAVLCAADRSVGFVFDQFEGYLAVPSQALAHAEDPAPLLVREVITGDPPRGVLSLRAILDAVQREGANPEQP